jgi:hypothetical protein
MFSCNQSQAGKQEGSNKMSKCATGQGNKLCAVQVMLIEVASWNLQQASWSSDGHEKSQRNFQAR